MLLNAVCRPSPLSRGVAVTSHALKRPHAAIASVHRADTSLHSEASRPRRSRACRLVTSARRTETVDGLDPTLEQAVPKDQRPANELRAIQKAGLYSWATLDTTGYFTRLGLLYAGTFGLLSGPISSQTFDPSQQPLEFFLSSNTGALLVVSFAVIRIYLGWSYVGNRLLSASVAYEETGWYDGQIFVKPQEVLARDRLLGTYEVRPALAKLKGSLVGSAAGLVLSAAALTFLIKSGTNADGLYGRGLSNPTPRQVTATGVLYSSKVKDINQLFYDDEAAEAEAAATGDRPAYCGDRYFKSLAGGEKVCAKFDVK